MPYATKQNLIDRFGEDELIQITDRHTRSDPENSGTIDTVVLDQAIADADAEINGYLNAYALPLSVVPANLIRIACDITRYYLYDDQDIETVTKRYDSAIAYLRMVASGKISLGADVAGNVPAEATGSPWIASDEPSFVSDW